MGQEQQLSSRVHFAKSPCFNSAPGAGRPAPFHPNSPLPPSVSAVSFLKLFVVRDFDDNQVSSLGDLQNK
ncbi:hypothetical protein PanWU01x14_260030 [Parasponia andersonii]|uniref:Uncharacterized protein n=1 Tax=Parasponia andersonii TaxID=3476 RepID=A0A2P5B925_PARAD|nr:hypothetical protein PanWU01x14_260030 [Parasponia andersonii]